MKPRKETPPSSHSGSSRSPSEESLSTQEAAEAEEQEILERTAPTGDVVYQAIYREGEHEVERNGRALAWSGLAAGLSMGFSFVSEALLRSYLPNTEWRPLISKLGYSTGFLIVILGRQQLFTKNTLTVMLPLFKRKEAALFAKVGRLWIIVLLANLTGAFAFTLIISQTPAFDTKAHQHFAEIASENLQFSFLTTLLRSVIAGWLIALMIWLLPFAESARIWVIALLAYVVGIGHFPHIVAGATPAFYLTLTGGVSLSRCLGDFIAPVLLGNIIGGVALVAALAHAEFIYASGGKRA